MRKLGKFQQEVYDTIPEKPVILSSLLHKLSPEVKNYSGRGTYTDFSRTSKAITQLQKKGLIVVENRGLITCTVHRKAAQ